MTAVFVDTFYWIALIDFNDGAHQRALAITSERVDSPIVTTDEGAGNRNISDGTTVRLLYSSEAQPPTDEMSDDGIHETVESEDDWQPAAPAVLPVATRFPSFDPQRNPRNADINGPNERKPSATKSEISYLFEQLLRLLNRPDFQQVKEVLQWFSLLFGISVFGVILRLTHCILRRAQT